MCWYFEVFVMTRANEFWMRWSLLRFAWDARVKWIVLVKFAGDKWICKCGCRKRKKLTNSTNVSDVEMTRFRQRVDLIRERHVRVKDEAKIASRGTDCGWYHCWEIIKFVRSENLRRCCFVPIRRNSVLDGLRSSLFKFIQERMSVKVLVSVSRDSL